MYFISNSGLRCSTKGDEYTFLGIVLDNNECIILCLSDSSDFIQQRLIWQFILSKYSLPILCKWPLSWMGFDFCIFFKILHVVKLLRACVGWNNVPICIFIFYITVTLHDEKWPWNEHFLYTCTLSLKYWSILNFLFHSDDCIK